VSGEHEETLDLVLRCADGDDGAWQELLRRYGAFLDYMVRRALVASRGGRLPSADEVVDLRDEVVAWLVADEGRVLRTYRGESKLTSWLGVVVGRRARRLARRGQGLRQKTVSLDALSAEGIARWAAEAADVYAHGAFRSGPPAAPDPAPPQPPAPDRGAP